MTAEREGPSTALIKFCGITRAEDAAYALQIGASYVGAIFAPSPRRVTPGVASAVYLGAGPLIKSVAVFGAMAADEIADAANIVGANVIQLHAITTPGEIESIRRNFRGEIWAFVPVDSARGTPHENAGEIAAVADAILLDTTALGRSGGTGVPLDWARLADGIDDIRSLARIVLAGGLNPTNVGKAMRLLSPDVVDVSSGVESAPGIKDHRLMLAFADAVRSASIDRGGIPPSTKLESK